jgi:hypothetical protein
MLLKEKVVIRTVSRRAVQISADPDGCLKIKGLRDNQGSCLHAIERKVVITQRCRLAYPFQSIQMVD